MLSINISEVIWTVINFFLLMFLLKKFLYTPIINFMDARNERIEAARSAKLEAEANAASVQEAIDADREQSRAKARSIIGEARSADEREHAAVVAQAKLDEVSKRRTMKADVVAQRDSLEAELAESETLLAADLAEHLLTAVDDGVRVRANVGMPKCSRDRNWAQAEPVAVKPAPDETERILSRARAMDKRRALAGVVDTGMADTVVRLRDGVESEMQSQEMELAIMLAEKILGEDDN